jgi:hypothetical protein
MPNCYFLGILLLAGSTLAATASAPLGYPEPTASTSSSGRSTPASSGAGYEISPTVGFMGGSALLGLRAAMNYRPVTLELSAEQVMGRTATLFPLTVNAILDLAPASRAVPFAILGGGLFLTVPANTVGDQTVSSMGANFGGGLRFYLGPKLGLRFETKQLFTRVTNHLDDRQELLIFQSSSLGVIFAFD